MSAHCRSCGAPILWRKYLMTGAAMPIDAEPVPDGDLVLVDDFTYAYAEPATTLPTYVSHFATCPQSREWRKRKPYTGGVQWSQRR